jgi:polyisoprenoid-binding protein YceI
MEVKMKKLPWLRLVLITLVGLGASAARAENPKPVAFDVDKDASRVYIKVTRTNRLGHNHGVEGKLASGTLAVGGKGSLVFDMSTFTADTAQARRYVGLDPEFSASDARKVNDNMRGADCLDVKNHPQATFAVTSMFAAPNEPAGRYILDGQFTLHGVTRPLRFLAESVATNQAGAFGLRGWFKVKQSEFGMKPFSVAGGAIGVEDELTIHGDLVIRPAAR